MFIPEFNQKIIKIIQIYSIYNSFVQAWISAEPWLMPLNFEQLFFYTIIYYLDGCFQKQISMKVESMSKHLITKLLQN